MGHCFQDVGITEWTNLIARWCPIKADCTKTNFDECIRDYLEAVAGFPNAGNQLICWLCTAKKPTLMPMHTRCQVQLLSYLDGGYVRQMMELPTAQEKSNESSLRSPRCISLSSWTQTRWCPWTHFGLSPFSSSVKLPKKRPAFLRRLPRRSSSQKRRRRLIFPSCAAVIQATGRIVARIATIIEATNANATTDDPIIIIKIIDTTITLITKTRTTRATSPMRRRMIASMITSRKRVTRPCTMTSPLNWAWTPHPEKRVALVQDLLLAFVPVLALTWAAGAMPTIMRLIMIARQACPPSAGTCTLPRTMTTDISIFLTRAILFLPPSLL